jgi:hypothetical protein
MTGPEHYLPIEQLMERVTWIDGGEISDSRAYPESLAAAQVHAVLALAAATALGTRAADGRA